MKKLLILLVLFVSSCTVPKSRYEILSEKYKSDPEMHYDVILRIHEKVQADRMYRRFILIDPNYIENI